MYSAFVACRWGP